MSPDESARRDPSWTAQRNTTKGEPGEDSALYHPVIRVFMASSTHLDRIRPFQCDLTIGIVRDIPPFVVGASNTTLNNFTGSIHQKIFSRFLALPPTPGRDSPAYMPLIGGTVGHHSTPSAGRPQLTNTTTNTSRISPYYSLYSIPVVYTVCA